MLLPFKEKFPEVHESVFIAQTAVIIGDVVIGRDSGVWFNTVIRGDVDIIRIEERTNIQDGCILHVTTNKYSLHIGSDVTVGHNAIVHGCTVKDKVLIGMGAIVLDNATVNSNSLVAAGSVVKEGFEVPEGVLVAGVPAKIIRDLTGDEINSIIKSAAGYMHLAKTYMQAL